MSWILKSMLLRKDKKELEENYQEKFFSHDFKYLYSGAHSDYFERYYACTKCKCKTSIYRLTDGGFVYKHERASLDFTYWYYEDFCLNEQMKYACE